MTIMHLILWFGASGALILSIGIARGSRLSGYNAFADGDLGPGDVDAGHYLASGHIAWATGPSAPQRRMKRRQSSRC